MDFYQSQNSSKYHNNNNNKKRLSNDQVRLLERNFSGSRKLEPERKLQLANQLGIPPRQVAVWYQNKRARWRTQNLEMDCGAMQIRLDHASAEKRILEREVDRLRRELEKVKELLFAVDDKKSTAGFYWSNNNNNNNNIEVEGSAGSSSLCDTVNTTSNSNYQDDTTLTVDDQVLQFDHELFASFIHGSDDDERIVL